MHNFTIAMAIAALSACGPGAASPGPGGGPAGGQARCEDASTEPDGSPHEAVRPPSGSDMNVSIDVEGDGTISGLDPSCALEGTSGGFTGLYQGDATVDDNGVYTASLAEGSFTTPSGACVIDNLQIGSFTSVVVRGELQNTQKNCTTYCDAKARAAAESACDGEADQASCRSSAEADYSGSCTTECTSSTTRRIVAETSLGVTDLASLNAQGLSGATIGEVNADLTFDHIENDDGSEVDEAP